VGSIRRACAAFAIASICLSGPRLCAQADHEQHEAANAPDQPSSLLVRAFGAVEWAGSQQAETPNSFGLGQFALFATSNLHERVSVLAEVVLEAGGSNTRVVTDLERLQITFRLSDVLNLSAGRYHTGIGYYNAAFHHGAFFETPIDRPRVFAFEDEGGVLPVHEVGLSASGIVPRTGSTLRYLAEVGNGRNFDAGVRGETDEEGHDRNGAKSTNLGLSFRPSGSSGLELGGSYYHDRVPRSVGLQVNMRIGAAYAVYRTPSIELMAEWLRLQHRTDGGGSFANDAGYLQGSRAWGKWRPYYRYDRLAIDPATPLIGSTGSYRSNIAGVRFDPTQWVGLKAQYEHTDEPRQPGIDAVRVQLVFVF
jgi:hypothetical protein